MCNRRLKSSRNLHRSTSATATKANCLFAAPPSTNARGVPPAHAHHRRRSNPHSARRTASLHLPRFPPLEVFGRRPPVPVTPFVSGRHPKTFTFASILPCPLSRPLSTTPDITSSDRNPSACRLPAPDLQTTGTAAAAPASWLRSRQRQPDGQNPFPLCRALRSACVIRGKRIESPPNGLIWAVGYFVERSRVRQRRRDAEKARQ